jgi:hypothetical protein
MWEFLKAKSSREDVATSLQYIVDGLDHVWSDFTDVPIRDQELDQIRLRILALESSHPPTDSHSYLSPEGLQIVQSIIRELRSGDDAGRV